MAIILDGTALAKAIKKDIKTQVEKMATPPGLAVIIVGDDSASHVYVKNKKKDCQICGIVSYEYSLPKETGQDNLLALIDELNQNPNIHGILVQSPLPTGYNEQEVFQRISPKKDVDAFHVNSAGGILRGEYSFLPCTPAGVISLLDHYEIDLVGKHCVVVGHSNIVGKPMALMLLNRDATVTVCHIHTKDLSSHTRQADILISAVGKKINLITADMVKPGVVIVDVGINYKEDGKICGDVDFDAISKKASYISPVPGGVGPMTRAMLMQNTLQSAQNHSKT